MGGYLSTHMSVQQAARTLDARQETGHHYTIFSNSAAAIGRVKLDRRPEPAKERKGLAGRFYQLLSGHAAKPCRPPSVRRWCEYVCNLLFIYRYVWPEGPWQRLAAALAGSSGVFG